MSGREVRFCTTEDGASIAYCVEGAGTTTILALPAFIESFALDHLMPVYQEFYRELGRGRRVVRFDRRGTGLSVDAGSGGRWIFEEEVLDIVAIAEAIGGKVTVWASTTAGPGAVRLALEYPGLVERLILYGTYKDIDDAMDPRLVSATTDLARVNWETATRTIADTNGRREFPVEAGQLGEWYQRSETGEDYVARLERFQASRSVEPPPAFSQLTTPALVMHRMADPSIRFVAGQRLAAALPNARFVPLSGEGHLFCLGDYSAILAAVDEFIGDREEMAPVAMVASGTAVILFTDIVSSTELTESMGDAAFREMSRSLDAGLRAAIRECGGVTVEAKTLGDGVLATFGSAAQAIEGARRCLALSAASELGLHIGVHAGDVIREEGNVFGGAVNIAARICGLSEAGEILVSDVVRGMARSSAGVVFEDRGEREMKGVGEAVRVYAVRADESSHPPETDRS